MVLLAINFDSGFIKDVKDSNYSGFIYFRGFLICTFAHIYSSLILNWIAVVLYWIVVITIAGVFCFQASINWWGWFPLFFLCVVITPFLEKVK